MSTDAEWLEAALAEVEATLTLHGMAIALRIQHAVRSWVDATLYVEDAVYRDRFERRLADAIFASHPGGWCDESITALDVSRALHTCVRAQRFHDANLAIVTTESSQMSHPS